MFDWNCEIWSILWNLVKIMKSGQNCEIWSKMWNLVNHCWSSSWRLGRVCVCVDCSDHCWESPEYQIWWESVFLGRLKLKWSKASLRENDPWIPLKVTEVNQNFLDGLKHFNNPYFPKKEDPLWYILALTVPFLIVVTPIGGQHPVLYFQIQMSEKYSTAMC